MTEPEVFRGGTGRPLLLLHAGGATWRQWSPTLPWLLPHRAVIAPTMAGHLGGPPLPSGPLRIEMLADAVERELDRAGLSSVDIAGNSIGGFTALELARRGRADKLVLIDPMGMQSPEKAERIVRSLVLGHRVATSMAPVALPLLAFPAVRKRVLRAAFGLVHGERVPASLARHLYRAIIYCDVPAGFHGDPGALRIRSVHEITNPTLIIHGTQDPIATRDQIDRFLAELPDARLVELQGAGHCPQLEHPARVAAEILRFTGGSGELPLAEAAPSRRAKLVAGASLRIVRPVLDRASPRGPGLRALRGIVECAAVLRAPSGLPRDGWVTAPGLRAGTEAIMYLHGGGYVFGTPHAYVPLARQLSLAAGAPVKVARYRLAPEHPFPAAADDALAAYDELRAQGFDRIALVWDSVGGHLIAGLIGELERTGRPLPSAAALFSPALDYTAAETLQRDRRCRDPLLSPTTGLKCLAAYWNAATPDEPRIDVLGSVVACWPPTLIQVGGTECLVGDAERLTKLLAAVGVDCHLQVWPGQMHVFQAFGLVPEARVAVQQAGIWLRHRLDDADA